MSSAPDTGSSHFTGLAEARAVWEFTTGDEAAFLDKLSLVLTTAESFAAAGVTPRFVLLLRGPVMKFCVGERERTSFAGETLGRVEAIHAVFHALARLGTRVELCRVSMRRRGVTDDNVLPFAVVEENVFVSSIALQNKGYALMTVE
jgi:intracellular sulfur oxidation DsrE/DsrF family protein